MTMFVVLSPASSPQLGDLKTAMGRVFQDSYFEIAEGQFVAVAPELNSIQIGERLGPEGKVGQFVVFTADGHYGWHRKDLWSWLQTRASQ